MPHRRFGLAAPAALVALAALVSCARERPGPADVVIVTLDTTRRDHLGCYGYDKDVSPRLDAFARRSDLYTRAYASSSWTVPTHASILTGLDPTDHGADLPPVVTPGARASLASGVLTLAQHLSAQGYATGAFIGAPTLDGRFGLAQGFDLYDDDFSRADPDAGRSGDELTSRALEWVTAQGRRPILLLVNYFDPHKPYRPPEPCRSRFAPGLQPQARDQRTWYSPPLSDQVRLYDAEICFMDTQFGELMRGLTAAGRFDAAVIAVAADHGEAFGEHGEVGHGRNLIEPLIHVPLIVKRPRQRGGRRLEDLFETRRLFQLVLREAGASLPEPLRERDAERDWVLSELMRGVDATHRAPYRAVIKWPWKLVQPSRGDAELYDLSADPGEERNRWDTEPAARREMEALLGVWLAERPAGRARAAAEIDSELQQRLRALGYAY